MTISGKLIAASFAWVGSETLGASVASSDADAVAAMAMVAMTDPTYDSKMSAPMPATSPTLSPTLSAITAGLRGSSSGIPASTLPTKSAPTSAVLVKMPPPTRAKRAIEEAPIAKPLIVDAWLISSQIPIALASAPIPKSPKPATASPITAPPEKAIFSAGPWPCWLAAWAVRTLA